MASQDAASWLDIMKDRSSRQIEQPQLQSKITDARIPNNPRPVTRQSSQRSINTLSVYPGRGLNRSSSAANVRRRSPEKPFARPEPKELPLRRPSKNAKPSNLVLKKQEKNEYPLDVDRDFSSRTSRMATPRGRRTARPGSIITSPTIQRSNTRKISSQTARLSSKTPVKLSSPLPVSPSSRQGPADEMFSDSGSLPSPNLDLVQSLIDDYTPVTPSLAPAPLALNATSKRGAGQRPDPTTIPAALSSPNLSPSSRYSPPGAFIARKPSTKSKRSSGIPSPLSNVLLGSPNKLSLWKQSDFIRVACSGQASLAEISQYIMQERIYLQSLARFLGLLLANVLLPAKPSGLMSSRSDGVKERAKRATKQAETNLLASRITSLSRGEIGASTSSRLAGMKARVAAPTAAALPVAVLPPNDIKSELETVSTNVKADLGEKLHDWLVARLVRLRRELDMIDEIAEEFPVVCEQQGAGATDITDGLNRLLYKLGNAIEKKGKSILAGMVLLFARENAHFDVWTKIGSGMMASKQESDDMDKGVTRGYLIPSWTSGETTRSVEELRKLVDLLWEDRFIAKVSLFAQRTEEVKGDGGWKDEMDAFELMWDTVLDIQSRFWPFVS